MAFRIAQPHAHPAAILGDELNAIAGTSLDAAPWREGSGERSSIDLILKNCLRLRNRGLTQRLGDGMMDKLNRLASHLELRRQALFHELNIVCRAIEQTKVAAQDTRMAKDLFCRLEKWHNELQKLVENLPILDRR